VKPRSRSPAARSSVFSSGPSTSIPMAMSMGTSSLDRYRYGRVDRIPTYWPGIGGVVGAGQLARMMGDAAHGAGVILTVLASSPDDSAVATADAAIYGSPEDVSSLDELAAHVDVITFDHELVDLDQISVLEARGVVIRPGARALRFASTRGTNDARSTPPVFPCHDSSSSTRRGTRC